MITVTWYWRAFIDTSDISLTRSPYGNKCDLIWFDLNIESPISQDSRVQWNAFHCTLQSPMERTIALLRKHWILIHKLFKGAVSSKILFSQTKILLKLYSNLFSTFLFPCLVLEIFHFVCNHMTSCTQLHI